MNGPLVAVAGLAQLLPNVLVQAADDVFVGPRLAAELRGQRFGAFALLIKTCVETGKRAFRRTLTRQ